LRYALQMALATFFISAVVYLFMRAARTRHWTRKPALVALLCLAALVIPDILVYVKASLFPQLSLARTANDFGWPPEVIKGALVLLITIAVGGIAVMWNRLVPIAVQGLIILSPLCLIFFGQLAFSMSSAADTAT